MVRDRTTADAVLFLFLRASLISAGLLVVMGVRVAGAQQTPKMIGSPFNGEQSATAALSVRVKDQTDALVSDARVFLVSEFSLRRVAEGQTDNAGELYFARLEPGEYAIQVEFPGLSTPRRSVFLSPGVLSKVDMSGTFHDAAMGETVVPPKHPVLKRVTRLVRKI